MTRRIVVGEISGVFGLRGWVKVHSYTRPRENIFSYSPWELEHRGGRRSVKVLTGRRQGRTLVAALEDIATSEEAAGLRGARISVDRAQLPPPGPGEFYWADLIGLEVVDLSGRILGRVDGLMETGANDVVIVRRPEGKEILIPWLRGRVIRAVDPDAGRILVDWDPDY